MGTTLVIVELLIIGFEVLIWVVLLLWRFDAIPIGLDDLKDCGPLMVTFVLGTAYTLGIVGDRFLGHLSTLVGWLCLCWKESSTGEAAAQKETPKGAQDDLYLTEIFQPHAYDYFENGNRQKRLLRATCFNSLFTALVLFFGYPLHRMPWTVALLLLTFVSAGTWWMSHATQKKSWGRLCSAMQRKQERPASIMGSPERSRPSERESGSAVLETVADLQPGEATAGRRFEPQRTQESK